jgi:Fe-Mn family superoxide dismutase
MTHQAKPLPFASAALRGLSEKLITSHHANNYTGAVNRLNAIAGKLAEADFAQLPGFMLNGLKREELIARNSMILHECYFDSLGGSGGNPAGAIEDRLRRDFGSIERWQSEFVAMGKALGGGSGWVLLVWCARDLRLLNQWASDHAHAIAGATPILALDMYEHSYHLDYGARAADYVDAFMGNIAWDRVGDAYRRAAR